MLGKAMGVDEWKADYWLLLPIGFWNCLAYLWHACLRTGNLPLWNKIRTVLINKEEGGQRPISIAVLAWRVGMTVIMKRATPWVDQWAPEELIGGLAERRSETIHEAIVEGIASALSRRLPCKPAFDG